MATTQKLEIANLICRFGEKYVLLDLAKEVVLPSFFKPLKRKAGKSNYFFDSVEMVSFETNGELILGVSGRLIKDTLLEREQIYDTEKGIVPDKSSIASAPSAQFLLLLNNHRLIYVKETRQAPSLNSFKSTLQAFLRTCHRKYLSNVKDALDAFLSKYHKEILNQSDTIKMYSESEFIDLNSIIERFEKSERDSPHFNILKQNLSKTTVAKNELIKHYPYPNLEVVPIASDDNIDRFLHRFDKIKELSIKILARNDEADDEGLFEELHKSSDHLNSKNTTTVFRNNKDGLDKDETNKQLQGHQGNEFINIKGLDVEGDRIQGNNEDVKISKDIEPLAKNTKKASGQMYKEYRTFIKNEIIKSPIHPDEQKKKIAQRINTLAETMKNEPETRTR